MLRLVNAYIKRHHLLEKGDRVLVALSGGADSVALLDILLRGGYECIAVHCNFHLRGEESMRDEQFVRDLCEQLSVRLIVQDFATTDYAQKHKISVEMAARELRYDLFEKLRIENNCKAIAVAHHKNDQAETLILNLCRGTGIRGLAGMRPKNNHIIRPLLCCTHEGILNYLRLRKLAHVEDSTNQDTSIKRNLIRKQLSEYPESAICHIADTANYIQGYSKIIDAYIDSLRPQLLQQNDDEIRINIPFLLQTSAPEIVLYEILKDYGFTQTDEIYLSLFTTSGKYFYSETHKALKDREELIISGKNQCESNIPQVNIAIRNKKPQEIYPKEGELRIVVDAKIMDNPISFRHYQDGDRFTPIGMRGSKKLQDFFTDLHLNREEKKKVWLMLCGEEIAWVVGYRISDKFKVTKKTREVAEIEIKPLH